MTISETATIHPSATVNLGVTISEGVIVGPHAYIGEGVTISEGAYVAPGGLIPCLAFVDTLTLHVS